MQRRCLLVHLTRSSRFLSTACSPRILFARSALPPISVTKRLSSLSAYSSIPWIQHCDSNSPTASDTIYALSTASGRAAIAVIRISGPACLSIYASLCPDRNPPKPRTATLRKLCHPLNISQTLDVGALVLYFPAPNTVTGEDVLELHVHGGSAIVRSLLDAIPQSLSTDKSGKIRHAEAGEFTKRAFYNNRIDLTQAEALGESLAAETEQQHRLAMNGSSNVLAIRYEEWRNMLLYARGELEALIDFSEDQHFDESPKEFMSSVSLQIQELKTQIQLHIHNASKGELLRNGIAVALLGAPNAGKSSLLNRIVGREATIVSAEHGTTRDIVDISIDIQGWLVKLGDMAGLRRADQTSESVGNNSQIGAIELEGIRRARERAFQSDLIIVLIALRKTLDGVIELDLNDELVSTVYEAQALGKHLVFTLNKIDLLHGQPQGQKRSLSFFLSKVIEAFPTASPNDFFCLSCVSADVADPNVSDPGGVQTFLSGLVAKFSSITEAISGEESRAQMMAKDAQSYWTASLSVTHRQSMYLKECLTHLEHFLVLADPAKHAEQDSMHNSKLSHHIDGHADLIAERAVHSALPVYRTPSDEEIDIVTAAEHLRHAADCLARITGKTESGDVEDILGVVFEK